MKLKQVLLTLALLFPLMATFGWGQNPPPDSDQNCYRCHSMKTLSYRDSVTNAIVSLYVDSTKFKHSNHAELGCVDCHDDDGFLQYPHTMEARSQKLQCTDCHDSFENNYEQFEKSVHYKKFGDRFSCFSCHDPHAFKASSDTTKPQELIAKDNAICLDCHSSKTALAELDSAGIYHDLITAHQWLPKLQLHWKAVRCIECHTPATDSTFSHEILPKEKAIKKCEECHSTNSILFTKLYRFKVKEARQKEGLLKSLAKNTPYVVGMTRDPILDRWSIYLFILTLLGLGAHATGRWLSGRRKKK